MHATIQKPLDEILSALKEGEKVMVVGCGNCAAKAKSGGEPEAEAMVQRLRAKGVMVTGWAVPPNGGSLCKLSAPQQLLNEDHKAETEAADSFLVLACGQGVHTVIDATDARAVHPGCDTVFGGGGGRQLRTITSPSTARCAANASWRTRGDCARSPSVRSRSSMDRVAEPRMVSARWILSVTVAGTSSSSG